jgi:hypothetical protein
VKKCVAVVFVFLLAAGAFAQTIPPGIQMGPTTTIADDHTLYVVGSITNASGRTLSMVNVQIALYDAGGARISTTGDFVTDLEPGSTWKWKAPIPQTGAASYKIIGVGAE